MNSIRKGKVEQVQLLTDKLQNTNALVVFTYHGLSVSTLQELRQQLVESNVELKIFKNRLVKIAAKNAGYEKLNKYLIGPNAYAFGTDDDIAPAKIIANFAKQHVSLKMIAGTYENNVVDAKTLAEIATLPSFEEALTMLAGSMMAPLRYISVGLNMLKDLESTVVKESKTLKSSNNKITPSNEIKQDESNKENN